MVDSKMFLLLSLMLVVINIKGTAAAATHPDWKKHAVILLCNHPGSITDKASKIRDELHSDFPDYSWFVNVMDDNVAWSYYQDDHSSAEKWENKCGYHMFIWYKADSLIDKKSCTSKQKSAAEDIVKASDSKGVSNSDVRDKIQRLMKISGLGYHFISVDDGNSKSFFGANLYYYNDCFVFKDLNHDVSVYLK